MEQNERLEKNKNFFQGKQLFNTKLLQIFLQTKLQREECHEKEKLHTH